MSTDYTDNSSKKGFTLIELLVVIIIIGILAAIGIPQYTETIEKAKAGEAMAAFGHIQEGQKVYYVGNQKYWGEHVWDWGWAYFAEWDSQADGLATANRNLDITLTDKYFDYYMITLEWGGFQCHDLQMIRKSGRYANKYAVKNFVTGDLNSSACVADPNPYPYIQ